MAKGKLKNSSNKPKPGSRRNGAYNRRRGHSYETKIAKELRDIGFDGVVTSRSESKRMDDDKVDLVDTKHILPVDIQLKRTLATPNYLKIRDESSVPNERFVVIWAKQEKKDKNICTTGEVVMMDKQMFYNLLGCYLKDYGTDTRH